MMMLVLEFVGFLVFLVIWLFLLAYRFLNGSCVLWLHYLFLWLTK
jgi:hypothetical protein